jgi:hypothetical protein
MRFRAFHIALCVASFIPPTLSSAWAGPWDQDKESGVGRILAVSSDYEFVKQFRALSSQERAELIGLLTTEMAGWDLARTFDGALLQNGSRDLREDLANWLRRARPAKNAAEPSFFVELTQKPRTSRLRFEKLRCVGKSASLDSHGPSWSLVARAWAGDRGEAFVGNSNWEDLFFARVREIVCRAGTWFTHEPDSCGDGDQADEAAQSSSTSRSRDTASATSSGARQNVPCNRALKISFAVEEREKDGSEDVVLNSDVHRFLSLPRDRAAWHEFRNETWAAFERSVSSQKTYSHSLAQRLRVVDLAGDLLDSERFMKWRKLAVFLQAQFAAKQAEELLPCEWLATFYSAFSELPYPNDRKACPGLKITVAPTRRSLNAIQFTVPSLVVGTPRATRYFDQYSDEARELYAILLAQEASCSDRVYAFFEQARDKIASGLTSEYLSELVGELGIDKLDGVDVQGSAARLLVRRGQSSPLSLIELRNEKERIEALNELFVTTQIAFRGARVDDPRGRTILRHFLSEARLAKALLLEIDRRLAENEKPLDPDRRDPASSP